MTEAEEGTTKVSMPYRAVQVCSTCKLRKKRCDKTLPICGYCGKRNLLCRYEDFPQPKGESDAVAAMLMQMVSLLGPSGSMSTSHRIWYQVQRIIQFASLSLQEIGRCYFNNFHKWLPLISYQVYEEEVTAYNWMSCPPAADFSILTLAMCLITLQPNRETPITPQGLYGTVKVLFAETQAMMCAPDRLLQASLLIAAYEYANGRPEAAHITMGTSSRIAFGIGLHNTDFEQPFSVGDRVRIEERRRCNLWWGGIILERLIICEIKDKEQTPITEYPPPEFPLPTDLDCDGMDSPDADQIAQISSFGRQAQAVFLLDQVLAARRLPLTDKCKMLELRRLDRHLQDFLSMLMSTTTAKIGHDCGPIAPAVRALSLIHQEILDYSPDTVDMRCLHYSQSALEMITNVVVDVARHHKEQIACENARVDLLPLSCSYTLHLAMKNTRDCLGISCPHRHPSDLESLDQLDRVFSNRWKAKEQ
ncbi:hypothetical protein BO94DRAFT_589005 [Aspergillus sclerotioniger CBS 115572]|uniref:Zn(2)-C6 fungal-type domain-containing protein n=1 Tax=Aspergillus sclerotioniger CBS 115572 TaxID=1450535 RepID=A0A317VP65_9EURO|nr:hypothetical protein BO94DRAFT_589005 [Aspergillus sclerotioniger CBS 115572]PWY76153.1 hypothetical protein BO94DRAFT_589005 [Aspergillus sclerotioniger CBS 115572]